MLTAIKFTAAGFDTTANTMAYAVTLLAADPKWQTWIFEELDQVLPVDPTAEVDYKKVFPQLTRCLALMVPKIPSTRSLNKIINHVQYETLRVYPAVIHISRYIRATQTIKTTDSTHI